MSVDLRKKTWTIIFRPFGPQIMLALRGCDSKRQAKAIEAELLYALRGQDYSGLTPVARQACIKLFLNQKWEMPKVLQPKNNSIPKKIFTFWDAVELYTADPSFRRLNGRIRYVSKLKHLVSFFKKGTAIREIVAPAIENYRTYRASEGAKNATINREIAALSSIFRVLKQHQILKENPCRDVRKLNEKDSEREVYCF